MKTIAIALCAALMLGTAASGQPAEQPKTDDTIITDNTQIPNPWQDYDSLSDACDAAGYDFTIPEIIDGHDGIHFSVLGDGEIIEAVFGEDDGEITIRKAPGAEDISGDYNTYESTEKVTVGGIEVTLKGEAGYTLAIWSSKGYSYSLSLSSPLDISGWQAVIESII